MEIAKLTNLNASCGMWEDVELSETYRIERPKKTDTSKEEWKTYWREHFQSAELQIRRQAARVKTSKMYVYTPEGMDTLSADYSLMGLIKREYAKEFGYDDYNYIWSIVDDVLVLRVSSKSKSQEVEGFDEWNEMIRSQELDVRYKRVDTSDWHFGDHSIFTGELDERGETKGRYDGVDTSEDGTGAFTDDQKVEVRAIKDYADTACGSLPKLESTKVKEIVNFAK